jgi:hypothetical protein
MVQAPKELQRISYPSNTNRDRIGARPFCQLGILPTCRKTVVYEGQRGEEMGVELTTLFNKV